MSELTGTRFRATCTGGIGFLRRAAAVGQRLSGSSQELYPWWQGMQYFATMFSGEGESGPLDDDRYGQRHWASAREVLAARWTTATARPGACGSLAPVRRTTEHLLTDVEEVRRLVRENPWATIVSSTSRGLVASHYPVVLEEGAKGISLLSHLGRPDDELHELGQHEVLVVVQGPHGYVSPSWYPADQVIPTWNHVTAHLHATPQLLDEQENLRVLAQLVDHFEQRVPHPRSLRQDEDRARQVARGTVGVRLPVTRFEARLKLSQDKPPEVVRRVIEHLEGDGPYASAPLAAEMRRVHGA